LAALCDPWLEEPFSQSSGSRRDQVGVDVLKVSEDQFHVTAREAEPHGDDSFINASMPEKSNPVGERTEAAGQGGAGDMSAMGLPGLPEVDKTRVEPVFPTSLSHQLEKPFLETASDDPESSPRHRPPT